MVLLVCNVAEDIHVGIGVILELVLDRDMLLCWEQIWWIIHRLFHSYIAIYLEVLSEAQTSFISVHGTEGSSSGLSLLLLQPFLYVSLWIAKVNAQGVFRPNLECLNQVSDLEA